MNTTISALNKYFLNNENIYSLIENMDRFVEKPVIKKTSTIIKKTIKKSNMFDNFFIPNDKYHDSLFWCWIIFYEGMSSYSFSENYIYKIKNEQKISLIETLRKKQDILKKYRIKLSDVENNILYEEKLSLLSFKTLLIINNFNFVYITDKLFYESIDFYGNKTCYILKKNDRFGVWLSNDKINLEKVKSKRLIIDNLKKPLYSITYYKVQELKDMCLKINIDIMKTPTKCKTKKELYQLIIENI